MYVYACVPRDFSREGDARMRRFYRLTALLLAFLLAGALCGCAQLGLYGGESERDPETRMLTGEKTGCGWRILGKACPGRI